MFVLVQNSLHTFYRIKSQRFKLLQDDLTKRITQQDAKPDRSRTDSTECENKFREI